MFLHGAPALLRFLIKLPSSLDHQGTDFFSIVHGCYRYCFISNRYYSTYQIVIIFINVIRFKIIQFNVFTKRCK